MPFFLIFIIIPLAEIIVFMGVSDVIGLGTALIMALLTAILGGLIVRYQGTKTLAAAQSSLRRGILPSKELFDGLCLIAAGATLITPGFITDALGFILLVPPLRELLRQKLLNSGKFEISGFDARHEHVDIRGFGSTHHEQYTDPRGSQGAGIIDAEYETVDESKSKDKDA